MTRSPASDEVPWHLYVIRCRGGLLYTGITTDVERRLAEHREGAPRGARFLRGKKPLKLVFRQEVGPRGAALRLERAVKRMSRPEKLRVIAARTLPAELVERMRTPAARDPEDQSPE